MNLVKNIIKTIGYFVGGGVKVILKNSYIPSGCIVGKSAVVAKNLKRKM